MNTRNSSRGLGNTSLGRSQAARGPSASRNSISIDLSGPTTDTVPKVLRSPQVKIWDTEGRNASSDNLPEQANFEGAQSTENRNILSDFPNLSQPGTRSAGRTSNPETKLTEQAAGAVTNPNSNSPLDPLIGLMEQMMRSTREEFRKELDSIRDSISQIGSANLLNLNTSHEFSRNIRHSCVSDSGADRLGSHHNRSYIGNESNVKLEKWKISFDGSSSIVDFLFKVQTLAARSQCSDEHLLANFHVLLDGRAQEWYWLFLRQNRNVTYPLLRHALTREFGFIESDHDVILKISLRKQLFKESYDDFHTAILSMNLRLQNPLPDPTLIDIIKRNLNPNLRFLLFNADTRNLNEFRDTARRAEKVLRDTKYQGPTVGQHRNVSEIEVPVENEDEVETLDPQVEAISSFRKHSKSDFSGIQCWNCLTYGHSYIYCAKPIETPFCFKCGHRGVLTPKCPNNHTSGNRQMGDLATGDTRPSL